MKSKQTNKYMDCSEPWDISLLMTDNITNNCDIEDFYFCLSVLSIGMSQDPVALLSSSPCIALTHTSHFVALTSSPCFALTHTSHFVALTWSPHHLLALHSHTSHSVALTWSRCVALTFPASDDCNVRRSWEAGAINVWIGCVSSYVPCNRRHFLQ